MTRPHVVPWAMLGHRCLVKGWLCAEAAEAHTPSGACAFVGHSPIAWAAAVCQHFIQALAAGGRWSSECTHSERRPDSSTTALLLWLQGKVLDADGSASSCRQQRTEGQGWGISTSGVFAVLCSWQRAAAPPKRVLLLTDSRPTWCKTPACGNEQHKHLEQHHFRGN